MKLILKFTFAICILSSCTTIEPLSITNKGMPLRATQKSTTPVPVISTEKTNDTQVQEAPKKSPQDELKNQFSSITGRVTDKLDQPVNDGKVIIRSFDSTLKFEQTSAIRNGTYHLSNIPIGKNMEIIFEQSNNLLQKRLLSLESSEEGSTENEIHFQWISKDNLGGSVYDLDGNLLKESQVVLTSLNKNVPFARKTTTTNGSYYFEGVPADVEIEVSVIKEGYNWGKAKKQITLLNTFSDSLLKTDILDKTGVYTLDFGKNRAPDFSDATPGLGHKLSGLEQDGTDYFLGVVYDEQGAPLSGVKMRFRSLHSDISSGETFTNEKGQYLFMQGYVGIQLEITAEKEGFKSEKRVEVLVSGKAGDPQAHFYNFGVPNPPNDDRNDGKHYALLKS